MTQLQQFLFELSFGQENTRIYAETIKRVLRFNERPGAGHK